MIIALFALSLAMIIGGIASVVQGFPYVRLESGLAMTIAGATVASAGAVLLGLAVLARQIRALAQRPVEAAFAAPPAVELPMPPARDDPTRSEMSSPGVRRPMIAGAAGLAAGTAGATYLASDSRERPEPTFEASFEEPSPDPRPDPWPAPPEPLFPGLTEANLAPARTAEPTFDPPAEERTSAALLHDLPPTADPAEPVHRDEEPVPPAEADIASIPEPDADLFAPHAAAPAPVEPAHREPDLAEPDLAEPLPLRPALADDPAEPDAPAEPALAVVGTYVSGGNTYVMFSNGSIEAETPRGRFTFESLDELKAFVEAGGEGDRGAA